MSSVKPGAVGDAWVFKRYVTSNLFLSQSSLFIGSMNPSRTSGGSHDGGVRDLSLVMCRFRANAASWHNDTASAFDTHFARQGFTRSRADMRVSI